MMAPVVVTDKSDGSDDQDSIPAELDIDLGEDQIKSLSPCPSTRNEVIVNNSPLVSTVMSIQTDDNVRGSARSVQNQASGKEEIDLEQLPRGCAKDDDENKEKLSPTMSRDEQGYEQSIKFKYNPDIELAVARIVRDDEKDRYDHEGIEKSVIKQVAQPAFRHNPSQIENKKLFRRRILLILGCAVLVVAVVVLLLVLFIPSDDQVSHSINHPSMAPSMSSHARNSREQILLNYLAEELSPEVRVPGTPIANAAEWILHQDPQKLDIPIEKNLDQIKQRFALAALYFSSTENGSRPWLSCNPPKAMSNLKSNKSNDDICTFLELGRALDGSLVHEEVSGKIRWLSSRNECEWEGVICSENKKVQGIRLVGQGLSGNLDLHLPNEDKKTHDSNILVKAFPFLQAISLSYNELTGTIPALYGRFSNLIQMELHDNALTGEIPPSLFENLTSLQLLNLGANNLSGTLSTKIGQLTNLRGLHLYQNNLKGNFPTEIGYLSRLMTHSRIVGNEFSGSLPSELGKLTGLVEFIFSNNRFTGNIPREFGQLSSIDIFELNNNLLSGTIPVELCNMTNARSIRLERNALVGSLPTTELLLLQKLVRFQVSNNKLTGSIPSQLGNLPNLRLAWLHLNRFTGPVPLNVCDTASKQNGGLEILQADCAPIDNPSNACRCCSACCDRFTEICTSTR